MSPSTRYDAVITLGAAVSRAAAAKGSTTEASFRTLPAPGTKGRVRIAVGADITTKGEQPIFRQIAEVVPDAVFLIGDQMYADTLEPDFQSYADKYTRNWNIEHFRPLMQRFPMFMMWDDHTSTLDAGANPTASPTQTVRGPVLASCSNRR